MVTYISCHGKVLVSSLCLQERMFDQIVFFLFFLLVIKSQQSCCYVKFIDRLTLVRNRNHNSSTFQIEI